MKTQPLLNKNAKKKLQTLQQWQKSLRIILVFRYTPERIICGKPYSTKTNVFIRNNLILFFFFLFPIVKCMHSQIITSWIQCPLFCPCLFNFMTNITLWIWTKNKIKTLLLVTHIIFVTKKFWKLLIPTSFHSFDDIV
jgi:hypothetical protein